MLALIPEQRSQVEISQTRKKIVEGLAHQMSGFDKYLMSCTTRPKPLNDPIPVDLILTVHLRGRATMFRKLLQFFRFLITPCTMIDLIEHQIKDRPKLVHSDQGSTGETIDSRLRRSVE
jgi:hypothetical protein